MDRLRTALDSCLRVNLGVKRTETVLVVTDTAKASIGQGFHAAATKLAKEALLLIMDPRAVNGEEPPALVAEAMRACDVLLMPTLRSLSHTRARKAASLAGVRIASMPGITEEMIKRTFRADAKVIRKRCRKLCDLLDKGNKVRVVAPSGTDITFRIEGRKGLGRAGGIYTAPGAWGNLPAGESYIPPLEGKTNGTYVIDTASPLGGMLDRPIQVEVRDGMAVRISGGRQAKAFDAALRKVGGLAYNIAELGIGTNPAAKITGNILEDEKVYGTAHIALGNSRSFGGRVDVPIHLDGVFRRPTIWIDDRKIMEKGTLL